MCSICGGTRFDDRAMAVFDAAKDRGRDYSNIFYRNDSWICNHRAVPTTEVKDSEFNQPFGLEYKIVHNGTISNDKELGNPAGMIDSYVLSRILDCTSLMSLADGLQRVKGSFAIAVMKPNGQFYLACNYKPIFYAHTRDGELYFSSYKEHLEAAGLCDILRVKPYSVMDMETGEAIELPREKNDRALVICSGGLDSTAVAAYAVHQHEEVTLMHFQYGCIAQTKELECIKNIAQDLDCDYTVMPIDYKFSAGSSKLFGSPDKITTGVAGSEYAFEWVPARNLVMLALTVAYAEANGYSYIYLGTNLEESGAYPDNEEQFIRDFNACLYGAVQNGKYVEIRTPVGNLMKHEIVKFGYQYNAPFRHTWSCYKDGDKPCGCCGPCFMRRTAFKRNGLTDPLEYPAVIEQDEVE
jgi:7-cyano-7-deazaguanine synthase